MRWRYRDTVLALCTLAFFVTMTGRLAISPVLPAITDEFAVSNAAVGLALSGMWLAYGLAQYPSGILADRYGERSVILVAIGGTAAFGAFLAVAPVFAAFVVGTVLLGVFAGLHYSVATTLLSRTYDRIGTAVGVHNNGGTVAGLLAPVAAAWVGARYGWRPAVGLVALVGVPTVALFWWRIRPTEPKRPGAAIRDRVSFGPVAELLSRPPIAFTVVVAIAGEFAWQGIASFLPTFLAQHHGYSTTLAGSVFALYFVAQAPGQLAVGAAGDRFGYDTAIAACMLVGAAGIALLIVAPGVPAVAVATLCLGVAMSFDAAIMPRFLGAMTDAERNAGFGLVRTVYMVISSSGSVVVGLFADLRGWSFTFGFLGALFVAVLVVLVANRLFEWGY